MNTKGVVLAKRLGALVLLGVLAGCGVLATEDETSHSEATEAMPEAEVQMPDSSEPSGGDTSIDQLMIRREELCAMDIDDRHRLLRRYRSVFVEGDPRYRLPDALSEKAHQLNGLLLASCDPARTPGVLNEMLTVVGTEEGWSREHLAFFDLLMATNRAYAMLDGKNRQLHAELEALHDEFVDLQDAYEALETEHKKTIQGISDIERGIDLPQSDDLGL